MCEREREIAARRFSGNDDVRGSDTALEQAAIHREHIHEAVRPRMLRREAIVGDDDAGARRDRETPREPAVRARRAHREMRRHGHRADAGRVAGPAASALRPTRFAIVCCSIRTPRERCRRGARVARVARVRCWTTGSLDVSARREPLQALLHESAEDRREQPRATRLGRAVSEAGGDGRSAARTGADDITRASRAACRRWRRPGDRRRRRCRQMQQQRTVKSDAHFLPAASPGSVRRRPVAGPTSVGHAGCRLRMAAL